MPERRFEIRVSGRLSERARAAFSGMTIVDVPAETVISGTADEEARIYTVLALVQSLGLHVVSLEQVPSETRAQ